MPDPTTDFEIEKLIKLKLNPIDEKSRGSGYTLYGESYYWVTPLRRSPVLVRNVLGQTVPPLSPHASHCVVTLTPT